MPFDLFSVLALVAFEWMSRAKTSLRERENAKIGRRGGTSARHHLFAAAYIRNEGNGLKAAREAGYRGMDASLRVTASRLLKRAGVRAILAARMADAEAKIGGGMADEEIVARLTAQARADITPFIQFITPELAQLSIEGCGSDKVRARNALNLIEGRRFYLDVERALQAGHGVVLQDLVIAQDAMGKPEVRIKIRDPHPALVTLAKIKGLLRDKPRIPPASSVTLGLVLAELPTDTLKAMRAALQAAQEKARVVEVEAQPAGRR